MRKARTSLNRLNAYLKLQEHLAGKGIYQWHKSTLLYKFTVLYVDRDFHRPSQISELCWDKGYTIYFKLQQASWNWMPTDSMNPIIATAKFVEHLDRRSSSTIDYYFKTTSQ